MRIYITLTASVALHVFVIFFFNGDSFKEAEIPNEKHGRLSVTLVPKIPASGDDLALKSDEEFIRQMEKEMGLEPQSPHTDCSPQDPII